MAQEVFTLTQNDVDNLATVIKEHVKKTKAPAQDTFCRIWPQAKEGLQLLSTFIAAIPKVGVFARASIGIVIAAADAASSVVCK